MRDAAQRYSHFAIGSHDLVLVSISGAWAVGILLKSTNQCNLEIRNVMRDTLVFALVLLTLVAGFLQIPNTDGSRALQNRHAGRTYFELESVGKASRWNTLLALQVLRYYQANI